jgi:ATP-dependent helicase/nuclease subunit A
VRFDAPDTLLRSDTLRPYAELLERLRRRRHERPFAETVSDLLASRAAELAVRAECVPFGLQASANLERLVLNARALDREGLSFREARERLAARVEDRIGEPRAVEEKHEAVRVTTIHKAKGLEYDTVVVAGLGLSTEREPESRLRAAGGEWGARLEFGTVTASTPGFARIDDAEAERRAAERKRLLYVAFTRAKRRLVVSTFARPKQSGAPLEGTLLESIAFAFEPEALHCRVERVDADVTPPPERRTNETLGLFAGDVEGELRAVEARRARLLATASLPLARAGRVDPPPEDTPRLDRGGAGGARALRIGVAVHAAMERLLAPGAAAPESALDSVLATLDEAGPEDLPEVRRLVKRLLAHDVVARALASKRRFLELPVLFRDGEGPGAPLVEGKIDLLFEEEDGFTIVDWKTDRLAGEEERERAEERYAPQLAAYASALAAVLGPEARIKDLRLVFARTW